MGQSGAGVQNPVNSQRHGDARGFGRGRSASHQRTVWRGTSSAGRPRALEGTHGARQLPGHFGRRYAALLLQQKGLCALPGQTQTQWANALPSPTPGRRAGASGTGNGFSDGRGSGPAAGRQLKKRLRAKCG
ncbi:MAG: hypothetical protein KIPDCIKN_03903 [Haliscomenobacter sp.]|nr:hypothetical protein [Haliscomenobacter sp.]